jgi:hypothetical protein
MPDSHRETGIAAKSRNRTFDQSYGRLLMERWRDPQSLPSPELFPPELHANELSFFVEVTQVRRQGCYDTGGEPVDVISYRYGTRSVDSEVNYSPRVHHQVDGFLLEGYAGGGLSDISGGSWSKWTGPGGEELGQDECGKDQNGNDLHPAHAPILDAPTVDGLFVSYNGDGVKSGRNFSSQLRKKGSG